MASYKLYDLAGADDGLRFSPYCWRARMALAHKGLPVQTIPWRFTDKPDIAFSGQGKVPVLQNGDTSIADSWAIAVYLETTYPDRPSLFGGPTAEAAIRFINAWADRVVVPGIVPMIVADIWSRLHEKDRAYFRESREKALGATLESLSSDRDTRVITFRRTLDPLRSVLRTQKFLGGTTPNYADYIPFGCFQWARRTSDFALLTADDPITEWDNRMQDLFDGLARQKAA